MLCHSQLTDASLLTVGCPPHSSPRPPPLQVVNFTVEADVAPAATRAKDRGEMVPWRTMYHTLPLSMAYLVYMVLGMSSLRGVNLAMYTTLRRTTSAFTMVAE